MAKTLKDILATEVYEPKSPDERRFKDKHITVKHKDRNGNDDKLFNASNIKPVDRTKEGHGYNPGDDEKVYEDYEKDAADASKKYGAYAKHEKAMSKSNSLAAQLSPTYRKEMDNRSKQSAKLSKKYAKKATTGMSEEVEQIDEAVAADVYDAHHARALKSLANMSKHVEKHKKLCCAKGKSPMSWHASDMKALSRQLEDMEHNMAQNNEYAQPMVDVAKSNS